MRRTCVILAVGLLVLVAAACGDDDASDGAGDAGDTTAQADVPATDEDGDEDEDAGGGQDGAEGGDADGGSADFATVDDLVAAFGLSGCAPGPGTVMQVSTQPAESLVCGDTGEVDWYDDAPSRDAALAEAADEICSEVDGDFSFLAGRWWTVTLMLPTEPSSDDTALEIVAGRSPSTGEIATIDC